MNKITKIVLVLFTSLSMSLSAFAGELSVTGSAKASYAIGGSTSGSKGIGISNEFTLSAVGELDNGYTWKYAVDFDPNAGATTTANDDQKLVFGTPYGAVGIYVSEGGLSKEYGYGIGAVGPGNDYAGTMTRHFGDDMSSYENVQYHTPSGLLPYNTTVKVGIAPNMSSSASSDFKTKGAAETGLKGSRAQMYQIVSSPMDGLEVGLSYFETNGGHAKQTPTSGDAYVKYAMGAFTLGYGRNYSDETLDADKESGTSQYNNSSMGVQFAVNDALSVSYSRDKAQKRINQGFLDGAGADATRAKTSDESTVQYYQAAYNIGGATLGIARVATDDTAYTSGAADTTLTLFTIAMAF